VRRWTVTGDKAAIRSTARQMIGAMTQQLDEDFDIDLVPGRAVRDAQEFGAGCFVPTRWYPPESSVFQRP